MSAPSDSLSFKERPTKAAAFLSGAKAAKKRCYFAEKIKKGADIPPLPAFFIYLLPFSAYLKEGKTTEMS